MKVAPLTGTFMITSIVGFLICVFYLWDCCKDYAFAGAIVFAAMFIASVISMTHAPMEDYDYTRKHKMRQMRAAAKPKKIVKKPRTAGKKKTSRTSSKARSAKKKTVKKKAAKKVKKAKKKK